MLESLASPQTALRNRNFTSQCSRINPHSIALFCTLCVVAGCVPELPDSEPRPQATSERVIELIGHDYQLYFRYPGKDGQLHSDDDRHGTQDMIVVAGEHVRLRLLSHDFIYTIEIPDVEVYESAVPELVFESTFVAPELGTFQILGSQMCGYDHPGLIGKLFVVTEADFTKSMSSLPTIPIRKP